MKYFILNPSEIGNRKDVYFYLPEYRNVIRAISRLSNIVSLGEIITGIRYGASVENDYVDSPDGIPFLRIQNLKDYGLDLTDIKYLNPGLKKAIGTCYVKEGDILISRSGTVGIVAYVPEEADGFAYGSYIIKFRVKPKVSPDYIASYLSTNFGKTQIKRLTTGAVQTNITIPAIKSIKVPIPSKKIQNRIAGIMRAAHRKRKAKIQRVAELPDRINNFLLDKLDIKITKPKFDKSYLIKLGELRGRRDPMFYHPKYLNLLKAIKQSLYEMKNLSEMSKIITSGQRPKGGVKYIRDGVPSLGGEHITSNGDFNFEEVRYIPKEFHEKNKKSCINLYDILIVKDGATTGKVALVTNDFPFKDSNINEHVFKITLKSGYNEYYIFCYLFSLLGQTQISRMISGAAQKGITREAINNVKIIIPAVPLQQKIAEEVIKLRAETKKALKESDEIIENAKREVESLIVKERK